jgi:hypothetical protein
MNSKRHFLWARKLRHLRIARLATSEIRQKQRVARITATQRRLAATRGPSTQGFGDLAQEVEQHGLGVADDMIKRAVMFMHMLQQIEEGLLTAPRQAQPDVAMVTRRLTTLDQALTLQILDDRGYGRLVAGDHMPEAALDDVGVVVNDHHHCETAGFETSEGGMAPESAEGGILGLSQVKAD